MKSNGAAVLERVCEAGRGFTVVEVLIALAITALLLTAIAAVLDGSVASYKESEDLFKTTHMARQALTRITTQLRTAQYVETSSPNNECRLTTSDGDDITYRYNSEENRLYLVDNTSNASYVLCENVTGMTFGRETTGSPVYVRKVQISMTVSRGGAERTISAASVVRRNLR